MSPQSGVGQFGWMQKRWSYERVQWDPARVKLHINKMSILFFNVVRSLFIVPFNLRSEKSISGCVCFREVEFVSKSPHIPPAMFVTIAANPEHWKWIVSFYVQLYQPDLFYSTRGRSVSKNLKTDYFCVSFGPNLMWFVQSSFCVLIVDSVIPTNNHC